MKKRLICTIMSLAMAVMVATPVMAAENVKGDADGNGFVDQADLDVVEKYILDESNYSICLDLADVNGDGNVDVADYVQIQKMIAAGVKGDVNGDKYVDRADSALLKEYLLDNSIEINAENADVNNDGKVDLEDYLEVTEMADKHIKGDVNNDGVVTEEDYTLLEAYLSNPSNTYINKYNSDMNGNTEVDAADLTILRAMLDGEGMTK